MLGNLIGGITKVFTSLGTGAAQLGNAVRAVGNTLFTGMAATGTGLSAASSGGGPLASILGGNSGGVLGNMLTGAIQQGLQGGLAGGAVSALQGEGFGAGFKQGALGGALAGGVGAGIQSLFSPTGFGGAIGGNVPFDAAAFGPGPLDMAGGARTVGGADALYGAEGANDLTRGSGRNDVIQNAHAIERGRDPALVGKAPTLPVPSAFPARPAAPTLPTGATGLGTASDQDGKNAWAGMMSGLGEQLISERQIEALMESREKDREFLREQQEQRTANYRVPDSALLGGKTTPAARKASVAAWKYDPSTGMIVKEA